MTEVELKLALPQDPGPGVLRMLAQTPLLTGCQVRRQQLHNLYFDTPDHQLLQRGMVLRLRRVGVGVRAKWLQTFKTTDGGATALSRRGEWESPLAGPVLSATALQATPWSSMDPKGTLFAQLQPCFSTEFTRRSWLLSWAGGSIIEVALDLGRVVAGGRQTPIRELELELKAGQASSLLEVALQLAQAVAVIPSSASKSERGYILAGGQGAPHPAAGLAAPATRDQLARAALQGAFRQFTTSLILLGLDDAPEHVHQARVAWRRFRCARRLFGPLSQAPFPAVADQLQGLLDKLGAVRDLEVARTETLPGLAGAYLAGDPKRAQLWQGMLGRLRRTNARLRTELHQLLNEPATGQALIRITEWLEAQADQRAPGAGPIDGPGSLQAWALGRVRAQRRKLRAARADVKDATRLHQVRILAKRLRYDIDALRACLPPKRARRWHMLATDLQTDIGQQRDAMLAASLVERMGGCTPIAEFLRGHVAGYTNANNKILPGSTCR